MIHVCPLSKLDETVDRVRPRHLISLLAGGTVMTRPASIAAENHLYLSMNDVVEIQSGMVVPSENHVRRLLDFAYGWDRVRPLVVHCYAGVSRSPAAAYIISLALRPDQDEMELAATLRWLSPSATPNLRLIALADELLGRQGRMVEAIKSIGRGADAFQGEPFALSLDN